jgi:hypothetical protein
MTKRIATGHAWPSTNKAQHGRKVSDEFTVLLCRIHHCHLRDRGDAAAWWIDPLQSLNVS